MGGMGGQCPGTPELKGPPRETHTHKRKKNRRGKKKIGREENKVRNFSNTRTGAPLDVSHEFKQMIENTKIKH